MAGTADGGTVSDERLAFRSQPFSLEPAALVPAEPAEPRAFGRDRQDRLPATPARSAVTAAGRRHGITVLAVRGAVARALDEEDAHGTPFLFVPALLMGGVALYLGLAAEPAVHSIVLGLAVLALVWRLAARHSVRAARLAAVPLLVTAGMGLAQGHVLWTDTPMLGAEVTTRLTGMIRRVELRPDGSARYTIDVTETRRPALRHGPERIRASVRKADPAAKPGTRISGLVRLQPPSGPARPGGYDFAFQAWFDGIGANGFFLGAPAIGPGTETSPPLVMEGLRKRLADRIRAHAPGDSGAIAAALVTGDRAAISEAANEALRVSGLAHMLSISGLHMALVAGTVMLAVRALIALFPVHASRRSARKQAAAAAFAVTTIYLFLAGASIPTQRSFLMLAVMLVALTLDRSAFTKRNLALAALAVVVLSPDAVTGPGFQMSFAATLALIAGFDLWNRRRRNHQPAEHRARAPFDWPLAFFGGLAASSLIAGTATSLYAAYHFHRVSLLGLPANLAAMPIVSLVTMPSAVVGTLAVPFGLDAPFYRLMALSLDWVVAIASFTQDVSPDGVVGAIGLPAMLLSSAALFLFCACRTWLRWLALLPAAFSVLAGFSAPLPLAVISEDARLVAVTGSGTLAVNRDRPNAFTLEQWQAAYAARRIVKPDSAEPRAGESAFTCAGTICRAPVSGMEGKADLVWIAGSGAGGAGTPDDTARARDLCGRPGVIVLAHSPSTNPCRPGQPALVITARDLALYGSAEVRADPVTGRPVVRHATNGAVRPWHAHRQWSRPARNLPPIVRDLRGQ